MAVKNMAASVLTRLKNQAKEERIPFQLVLQLFAQIRLFTENAALLTQWKAFAPAKEVGLSFEAAINRLGQFLEPVYRCILLKSDFEDHWSCKSRQWQRT